MTTEENFETESDMKLLQSRTPGLTVKELAARVHLLPPTSKRQKGLEREGHIQRGGAIRWIITRWGNNVIVLLQYPAEAACHDLIQQFMDTVQNIDQITACYNTTGDYDFQIKVYARDMKAYQDFMLNTLGNIGCMGSLHSIIVIGEIC